MEFQEKRDVYADIATLYYLGDMRQEEIARIYNISRFKVSRILKKCKEQKIITFQINASRNRSAALALRLAEALNVSKVLVAPSGTTDQDSKNFVGQLAAKYLNGILRDDMFVGIPWGSTVQTLLRYYDPPGCRNLTFVQLSGSICSMPIIDQGYMDGSELIRFLADKSGADSAWSAFQVPYIVSQPKLRDMLMKETLIARHTSLFDRLDVACIGLGSSAPAKSVSYLSGYITLDESKQLVEEGCAADISGIRLREDGSIAHTILDGRVLTITAESLRKVPTKIGIAAGADKAVSIIAGARAGLVNVLIVDEIAALSALEKLSSGQA